MILINKIQGLIQLNNKFLNFDDWWKLTFLLFDEVEVDEVEQQQQIEDEHEVDEVDK